MDSLQRAPNEHLLLDLTKDWVPQSLGDHSFTTEKGENLDAPRPAQYMVSEGMSDPLAPAVSSTENIDSTLPALPAPLGEVVSKAGRSTSCNMSQSNSIVNASSPGSSMRATLPLVIAAVAATSTTKKDRVPTPERFDFSRREGPDPRDGRSQGFPCFGNHTSMPHERISVGPQQARQVDCLPDLPLHIEYVPAYGAKAQTVMEQVKDEVKTNPHSREKLNAKTDHWC